MDGNFKRKFPREEMRNTNDHFPHLNFREVQPSVRFKVASENVEFWLKILGRRSSISTKIIEPKEQKKKIKIQKKGSSSQAERFNTSKKIT